MYQTAISELLERNLTTRAFKLWKQLNSLFPNIWDLPTSSTGKYHKKKDGRVPTCAEHVYSMLYSSVKIMRMFSVDKRSSDGDVLLLAVALHDALKYGMFGTQRHTDYSHDKLMGDVIVENEDTLREIFTEDQIKNLELMIRFHSGRWSTDHDNKDKIDFTQFPQYVLFIHMLDMLDTANCLKHDLEDRED
jgi:23S rRNA maturation-related 3'-5' exoribonuclease YhaM